MTNSCIFCEIVAHRAPANIIEEDGLVMAFVPLNPVVEGHILVVPHQHVSDFTDNPEVSAGTMWFASELAQKLGGPYNLITSKGPEATQSVFHLHLHLVPRKKDDGLALPWYSGRGGHK
jgi:histidine triad (HIT) family protein